MRHTQCLKRLTHRFGPLAEAVILTVSNDCAYCDASLPRSSPEGSHSESSFVGQQYRDGSVQAKGTVVLVLKHVQIVQAVGLRHNTRPCSNKMTAGVIISLSGLSNTAELTSTCAKPSGCRALLKGSTVAVTEVDRCCSVFLVCCSVLLHAS
jgi:hypothetical protein